MPHQVFAYTLAGKSLAIGFGVMPLGMIAFGGFGLGKFF